MARKKKHSFCCAKCEKNVSYPTLISAFGQIYALCLKCDFLFRSYGNKNFHQFASEGKEIWVAKNIREAKERREKGAFLWI